MRERKAAYADEFSRFHPLVNFVYFAFVIGFSVFCMHPVCLGISFFCALAYAMRLRNGIPPAVLKTLLCLLVLAVLVNAAFNHRGVSILFYLPSGNAMTVESIVYGFASALMLISVLLWFISADAVIGTDKFLYLFSRPVPALSMLLSMTFRFIPRFRERFELVRESREAMGLDDPGAGLWKRLKNALACFSAVLTWSLENTVEISDSMKARAYGTGRRSAMSNYRMMARDGAALGFYLLCAALLIAGCAAGGFQWSYFPAFSSSAHPLLTAGMSAVYLAVFISPLYFDGKSDLVWKRIRSTI